MFDVVALGESLIDFTPNGTNAQGIELFARNVGRAETSRELNKNKTWTEQDRGVG